MKTVLLAAALLCSSWTALYAAPALPAGTAEKATDKATEKAVTKLKEVAEKGKKAVGKTTAKTDAAEKAVKEKTTAVKAMPFRGAVAEIDAKAKTITVGANTYAVTDTTEIHDDGTPAKFSDIKKGNNVGGSWVQGKAARELVKLNLGVKQLGDATAKAEKKEEKKPAAKAEKAKAK